MTANPIAVPMIDDSANGALKTLSFPKILDRPLVAVKTPPLGSAMSCP